jgi:AcrR family transcriptional regulator
MSRGTATRERIIDRAFHLATQRGLAGLTIGALAEDLGLSKSGLFAHFGSKEDLQIEVIKAASARFVEHVVRPAIDVPRGRPRLERMLENWLAHVSDPALPGGCLLIAASSELDDREGRSRDCLAGELGLLQRTLVKAARLAVEAGHFRPDLDCGQFAFEAQAITMQYNHSRRLLRDPKAGQRARRAIQRLLDDSSRAS